MRPTPLETNRLLLVPLGRAPLNNASMKEARNPSLHRDFSLLWRFRQSWRVRQQSAGASHLSFAGSRMGLASALNSCTFKMSVDTATMFREITHCGWTDHSCQVAYASRGTMEQQQPRWLHILHRGDATVTKFSWPSGFPRTMPPTPGSPSCMLSAAVR